MSFQADTARIASYFVDTSAQDAYEHFKKAEQDCDVLAQHTDAHIFGEELYKHEGLSGLIVCDGSFGFGCFHSFVGKAIAEHGIDVVQSIDAACVAGWGAYGTGCFHGIGHGVLAYYGYTLDDLKKALSVCGTLSWKGVHSGCSSGAFMEYNFRTMEGPKSPGTRTFSYDGRYEPCASLSAYIESCYFELPSWWIFSGSSDAVTLGSYCADLRGEKERTDCYRGLGYSASAKVAFSADDAIAYCDSAGTGTAREACREGAAWAFYSDPQYRSLSDRICSMGMTTADAKRCSANTQFAMQ